MSKKNPQDEFAFGDITFEMIARYIREYEEQAREFEEKNKLRVPLPIPCIELRGRVLYTDISVEFDGKNFVVYFREAYQGKAITWGKLSSVKLLLRLHVVMHLQYYIPSNQVSIEGLGVSKKELTKFG